MWAEQPEIHDDRGEAESNDDHAVRRGDALVLIGRVPAVGLAGEDGQVASGESEHDREGLEGEDRPDDEGRLKARAKEWEHDVDQSSESARAEQLRRFGELA